MGGGESVARGVSHFYCMIFPRNHIEKKKISTVGQAEKRSEREVGLEKDVKTVEKMTSFLESVSVYSPKEDFERQDLHDAFSEVHDALTVAGKEADNFSHYLSAYRGMKQIIEKHGLAVSVFEGMLRKLGQKLQDNYDVDPGRITSIAFESEDIARTVAYEHRHFFTSTEQDIDDPGNFLGVVKKLIREKISSASRFVSIAALIIATGCAPLMQEENTQKTEFVHPSENEKKVPEITDLSEAGADVWQRFLKSCDDAFINDNLDLLLKEWEPLPDEEKIIVICALQDPLLSSSVSEFYALALDRFIAYYTESEDRLDIGVDLILKGAEHYFDQAVGILLYRDMRPFLIGMRKAQVEKFFSLMMRKEILFASDRSHRVSLLGNFLKYPACITDEDRLSLFQRFEERFPGSSSDEVLKAFEGLTIHVFLNSDIWDDANPSVQLQVAYEMLDKIPAHEVLYSSVCIELLQKAAFYHFYPEGERLFTTLFEKHLSGFTGEIPQILFLDFIIPSHYFKKILEYLPDDVFAKHAHLLLQFFSKKDDLDVQDVIRRIDVICPIASAVLGKGKKGIESSDYAYVEGFLQDPTLSLVYDVLSDWIPKEDVAVADSFHFAEHRMMIARNLYFQGVRDVDRVTESMVVEASKKILEKRAELQDVSPFEGREVVMFAGNEDWSRYAMTSDPYRFGSDAAIEEVERQGALSVNRFRADKDINRVAEQLSMMQAFSGTSDLNVLEWLRDSVEPIKEDGLDYISGTIGKLTVMIEGHGSKDGNVHLIGGYFFAEGGGGETWNCITPDDLADALNKRWRFVQQEVKEGNMTEEEGNRPVIIIYRSCYSSDQIRLLCERLKPSVPILAIGGSETAQPMFDDFDSPVFSKFLELILEGNSSTIDRFIKESMQLDRNNLTIYFRGADDDLMQISMKEVPADTAAIPA